MQIHYLKWHYQNLKLTTYECIEFQLFCLTNSTTGDI